MTTAHAWAAGGKSSALNKPHSTLNTPQKAVTSLPAAPMALSPQQAADHFNAALRCLDEDDQACLKQHQDALRPQAELSQLLAGNIAVNNDDNEQAFSRLKPLLSQPLPAFARANLHEMLATLYRRQEDASHALREYIASAQDLTDAQAVERNQLNIWVMLQNMNKQQLQLMRFQNTDPLQTGWLDLLLAYQTTVDSGDAALTKALDTWKKQYPQHPAQLFVEKLNTQDDAPDNAPNNVPGASTTPTAPSNKTAP